MNRENICNAYPHPILYGGLNLILLVSSVTMLALLSYDYGRQFRIVNIVFVIVLPIIFVATFIYTTFSGWNAKVVFSKNGIAQKQWGKLYRWCWEDIADISCKKRGSIFFWLGCYFPKMRFQMKDSKTKVITLNIKLLTKFESICPRDDLSKKFKQLLKECDYPFPGKNLV